MSTMFFRSALLPVCLMTGLLRAETNAPAAPRGPVHPRYNVEEFEPVRARWLRFTIFQTNSNEPCLDELEVFGPEDPARNFAPAENGTRTRCSGTLDGYRIHDLSHLNDGRYGNGHSWIANTKGTGWVELEFAEPVLINRVVWSRDRERKFIDRLAVDYQIEACAEPGQWQRVASSADRQPLPALPEGSGLAAGWTDLFSAASTEFPAPERPAGREYLLQSWQTADGLPASTVTALLQTRDGWLWVGTTNGLARFDGVRFTLFGEAHGLPNLTITCLHEDRAGTLWAGTEGGGLARWQGGTFLARPTGEGLAGNTVYAINEDAAGRLWVGTASGMGEWNGTSLTQMMAGPVARLARAGETLWMIDPERRLMRWDGRVAELLPATLDRSGFSSVGALAAGLEGTLWFGGSNGYVARMDNGEVASFGEGESVLSSNVVALLPDAGGKDVWVGSSASGLARLRGKDWLHLTTDDGLPSNAVRALCRDREGQLWAGTAGGGLTCLRPRRLETITTRDGLSHNAIMALCRDPSGVVWIGTHGGGLNRWDGKTAAPQAPSYLLENQSISSLAVRGDGTFWLGTSGRGAYRLQANASGPLMEVTGLPGRVVTALCEDAAGRLWFGTLDGGPACLDGEAVTFPPGIADLAGQPVTSIISDMSGKVWFGTNGQGAACLDAAGTLTRWTRADGLASSFIRTLRQDTTGAVWAGTSGGLTRWKDGAIFNFTEAHGLPDRVVSQIMDDGTGALWIGTNCGIARVPLASFDLVAAGRTAALEILSLGLGDGLPSLECTGGYHPAGLKTEDGKLCFGTVGGLVVIDPSHFSTPQDPPPVVLEAYSVGTFRRILTNPGSRVDIPASSRLGLEFTALAFQAPGRVRFRHRLLGLDSEWSAASGARTAAYAPAPPGDYQFEVMASADGGAWTGQPGLLSFRVLAPWWRTPLAMGAGTLLGAAGVAGLARTFTRRRLQRHLQEVERQFALERERSRIARDIHDDLGANLTQISLLSAAGAGQAHDPDKVRDRFTAISATSEELVQAMDAIVWAVNPRHDTLESLARYLVRFAGDFFLSTGVRLRLDVPPQLPEVMLGSELRHNLFLAAKEAMHNALRHSGGSQVELGISVEAGELIIHVSDNGKGFASPHAARGNGLANMQHRLAESGGTCHITSSPSGTRVTFMIPLPPLL